MNTITEQLLQIYEHATWDGDLVSKQERDQLISLGLVEKELNGMNVITLQGEYVAASLK